MPKQQDLKTLVKKYEDIKNSGKLKSYSEEQTKKDFILPLFEILGWDVYSRTEVSAEETISSERVDYGFYLNDRIKFYLEAKRFNVDIHDEKFANQAIKYSFNKGATWAVLTNFETLVVFNAQDIEGKLSDKRFFEINCVEFVDRFDQLALLSKESFKTDLLDKEAEKVGKKIQKISVTNLLYKDLQNCRDILTKDLSQWNGGVDPDLLDEGVQKLLDRLLFIRVAEDRGIEPSTLIPMVRQAREETKKQLYEAMTEKFREFDSYYNSNLFSPHPFEKWEEYSGATERVIHVLYGKEGYYEYDFKAMPADVLGTVYENYLSHRLSKSRKGTTVSKDAEKRKEQGIYYTPGYIVDYIVKNALGPVLDKCKTIEDIKRVKVLDPACGSGSFLIKVFGVIFEKYKELDFCGPEDLLKIQILQENIYGVDLDQQAVEITRLNLLINALTKREKLPFLNNIKNGNSLVSGTDEDLKEYFGANFKDKKPFNWQEQFPQVFKQGGFDVVIGNPPYIFTRGGGFEEDEKKYYYENYKIQKYQLNTFSLFIERGINLLKDKGEFGYIVPNNWLTINSFAFLREYLLKNTADLKIINADESVFSQASVDTCILIFKKDSPTDIQLGEIKDGAVLDLNTYKIKDFLKDEFIIHIGRSSSKADPIIKKLDGCDRLGNICTVKAGLKAYEVGKGIPLQTEKMKDERMYHSLKKEGNDYLKYLEGRDVKRYLINWGGSYLKYGKCLAAPRKFELFDSSRILVRQIPSPYPYCINGIFTKDEYLNDINSMIILNPKDGYDLIYILGIINSKLISYWFAKAFDKFQRKIFPQFKVNELEKFPIWKASAKEQKSIIQLVDDIIVLNKEIQKIAENSEKWVSLKSDIERINNKIDGEVYNLYSLTNEEIQIVESYNKKVDS